MLGECDWLAEADKDGDELGEIEADGLGLGLAEGEALGLREGEALGEIEDDGEVLGERLGLAEGLALADVLPPVGPINPPSSFIISSSRNSVPLQLVCAKNPKYT